MSNISAFACTVEGMCCAAETVPIERAVRSLPGVSQVVADAALARLTVTYDGATATAKVYGIAKDQSTKEKVLLAAGNIHGIAAVDDNMTVDLSEPESKFYTVVKGDTLSKIAKEFYGNANAYMKIFEANKPMLTHPDKIYPGQNLRIPQE